MAISTQDIQNYLAANPGMTDAQIAAAMDQYGVSASQLAAATGLGEQAVADRYAAQRAADYEGNLYNPDTLRNLYSQIVPNVDLSQLHGGVYNTSGESIGFNYDVGSQVLAPILGDRAPTSTEQLVLDMARYLNNRGITDLSQLTPEMAGRFGETYTGGGGTAYNVNFNPDGTPTFGTTGFSTSDKDKILLALAAGATLFGIPGLTNGLLSGAGTAGAAGTAAAGLGPIELAIAAGEGIIPVTAAQTATAGLTAAQLGALGSGIGLAAPVGSAVSSVFNAAKDSQLANEAIAAAGGNPLVGYLDPSLVPATVQIGNLTYGAGAPVVTSTGLPAGGGGAPTGGGGGTTTTPGGLPPGVTTTLTNLLKNPSNLAGLLGLLGGGSSSTGVGSIPTQGVPTDSPEYFNQVQGFLNQYLPGQMPTQSQYLSSWYNNTPGSYMPPAASAPAGTGGGGMMSPTTPTPPQASPSALPPQRADVVQTGGGKPGKKKKQVDDVTAEAIAMRGITSPDWMNVSLRDLVEKSGYSLSDQAALDRAQMALYGNIGANMDTRDWAAIMASDNPLAAAEAAAARMYSDPVYQAQNAQWLASQGFPEASAPLTYAQMVGRTGSSYTPTAAEAAMIAQEINKITSAAGGGYHQAELAGPAQVLANAGYAVDPGYKPYLSQPLQTAQPVNYGGLSSGSSASDIAQAYQQFTGGAAGDTVESRNAAIQYLQNIGIDPSRIGEAYSLFRA